MQFSLGLAFCRRWQCKRSRRVSNEINIMTHNGTVCIAADLCSCTMCKSCLVSYRISCLETEAKSTTRTDVHFLVDLCFWCSAFSKIFVMKVLCLVAFTYWMLHRFFPPGRLIKSRVSAKGCKQRVKYAVYWESVSFRLFFWKPDLKMIAVYEMS